MSELLIGCGRNRDKRIANGGNTDWLELTTLDINPDVGADVVHDLNIMPYPFEDASFDEIHAYDVVEHLGKQGDAESFFAFFNEIYRLLKEGGLFLAITPAWNSQWAWGDPGHTRVVNEGTICFLSQDNYEQCGETAMTDYRYMYKGNFGIAHSEHVNERYVFVLRKK